MTHVKMLPLLNYDERLFDYDMDKGYRAQQFMFKHPHLDWFLGLFRTLWFLWLYYVVCHIKGHDPVDNGYAGPDSGCIDMSCKRCGYSWPTVWLY